MSSASNICMTFFKYNCVMNSFSVEVSMYDGLVSLSSSLSRRSQTMQHVILTYMKHLGVKVKEPRGLEHKRARINFLPKIMVGSLI